MDEHIFIEHVNQNRQIIYKLINLYVDDEAEKQDLFQETLFQAWKSKNRFKGDAKFSTWLYKVCLHTILTAVRKKKRSLSDSLYNIKSEPTSDDDSAIKDQSEILYAAIKGLLEIEKTMITMHLEGFSNQEIAEFLGITLNHCNVKLFRVKNKLTEIIKRKADGITRSLECKGAIPTGFSRD